MGITSHSRSNGSLTVSRRRTAIERWLAKEAGLTIVERGGIPLVELRIGLAEHPRDRQIHVICRSGQRAYFATRTLLQNGFKAGIVSSGMLSCTIFATDGKE